MVEADPQAVHRTLRRQCFAVIVTFDLHAGASDRFLELVLGNSAATLCREQGCVAFDVLRPSPGEPQRVVLYEVYLDRAAFDQHLATDHFATFDAATREMVREKAVATYSVESAAAGSGGSVSHARAG